MGTAAWWVALAVVVAFELVGAWPVAPVEGDAEAIANGVLARAGGVVGEPRSAYRYAAQAGTYALVAALHRGAGLDPLVAFAAASTLAALAFVALGGALARELAGVPLPAGALAMLAVQETMTGGFYANSTALAAAVFMAGLLLSLRAVSASELALAGLTVGLAGWLRADVVLLAPALVPALCRRGPGPSSRRIALVGAVAIATVAAAGAASGAPAVEVLRDAAKQLGGGAQVAPGVPWVFGSQAARAVAAFLAPGWLILSLAGAALLLRRRRWRELAVVLAGALPVWLVYGRHLSSPKYVYCSVPFLVAAGCAALRGGRARWSRVAPVAVGLLAVQALVGVRLELRSRPWDSARGMGGPVLLSVPLASGPVARASIALGPGTLIPTDDGLRLSSGTAFAPLVWHDLKAGIARCDAAIGGALAPRGGGQTRVVTETWSAGRALERRLMALGYREDASAPIRVPAGRRTLWRRADATVVHVDCEVYGPGWPAQLRPVVLAGPGAVFYVAGTAREQEMLVRHLGADVLCGCGWPQGLGLLSVAAPAAAR